MPLRDVECRCLCWIFPLISPSYAWASLAGQPIGVLQDQLDTVEILERHALPFAVHAGREVRVMVEPESIDDLEATKMAIGIVKKIEEELAYPGQIKVTVIRESRSIEYAK